MADRQGNSGWLYFSGLQIHCRWMIVAMKLKDTYSLERKLWPIYTAYSKAETLLCQQRSILSRLLFSSSHVGMWELDYKESCTLKNWCFWTVVLEKALESLLDCKKIQPVHPKGGQSLVFIVRTDFEAETPILWPPDVKSWLIRKDPDAGKYWGQEEKGTTEDEMVRWHHQLDGHGFGWIPGVGDGPGGLACWGSWGCRVRHDWPTELNWCDT